jgi:flavin-dependent dehydrogenase
MDGTSLTLEDGSSVRCRVLIDATGLESRITAKEDSQYARGSSKSYPVGYQIAYGYIAHVTTLGPYNEKAMTLFDYR